MKGMPNEVQEYMDHLKEESNRILSHLRAFAPLSNTRQGLVTVYMQISEEMDRVDPTF